MSKSVVAFGNVRPSKDSANVDNIIELRSHFINFLNAAKEASKKIDDVADKLDKHSQNVDIAKVSGASGELAGRLISTAGFVLSFYTFGMSLSLTIAGAALSAAGGLTSIGAEIAREILTSDLKKDADRISKDINQTILEIDKTVEKIEIETPAYAKYEMIDEDVTNLDKLSAALKILELDIKGAITIAKAVKDITESALKLIEEDMDYIGVGCATVKKTVAGTITGKTAKRWYLLGGTIAIATIAIDVRSVVKHSISVHNKTPHDMSASIRERARKLRCAINEREQIVQVLDRLIEREQSDK